MKKFIITLLLCLLFAAPSSAVEMPVFEADSYILADTLGGRVLCSKNPDTVLYPASTTKIMTAILALEMGEPDMKMTASTRAVYDIGKDGMHIGIMPGEILSLKDLLNAMLVRSANETANIIAENLCSSRDEFVILMNKKSKEIGAVNTHFVNPCGAHHSKHYSTAEDMGKIAMYAMKIPEFRQIVRQESYRMSPTNKHSVWDTLLYTTNRLLRKEDSDLFEVTGIKTGYTNPAGSCLVSSAQNSEGMELVAVMLGVRNEKSYDNVFKYSEELLEYGFENYSLRKLICTGDIVETSTVSLGNRSESVNLIAKQDVVAVLPIQDEEGAVTINKNLASDISAPVNKGDVFGYVEYLRNGNIIGSTEVVASASVYGKTIDKTINKNAQNQEKSGTANTKIIKGLIYAAVFAVIAGIPGYYIVAATKKRRRKRSPF